MRDEIRYAREVEKLAQFTSNWNGGASLTISTLRTQPGTKCSKSQSNEKAKGAAKINKVAKSKATKAKPKPAHSNAKATEPIGIQKSSSLTSNGTQLGQKLLSSMQPAAYGTAIKADQSNQASLGNFQPINQVASISNASTQLPGGTLNFQPYVANTGINCNQSTFGNGFPYCANPVTSGPPTLSGLQNISQSQLQGLLPFQLMPFSNNQLQAYLNYQYNLAAPYVQPVQPFQSIQDIQSIQSIQAMQAIQNIQGTQGIQNFQAMLALQNGQSIKAVQAVPGMQFVQSIQGGQDLYGIQGFQGAEAFQLAQGLENGQGTQHFQNFQMDYNALSDYSSMFSNVSGQANQLFDSLSQNQNVPEASPVPQVQATLQTEIVPQVQIAPQVKTGAKVQTVLSVYSEQFTPFEAASQPVDTESSGEPLEKLKDDQFSKIKTFLGPSPAPSRKNSAFGQEQEANFQGDNDPDLVPQLAWTVPQSDTQTNATDSNTISESGTLDIFELIAFDLDSDQVEVVKQSQTTIDASASGGSNLADKNYTLDGQVTVSQKVDSPDDLDDVSESIPRYTGSEKSKEKQVEPNDWEKMQYDLLKELDDLQMGHDMMSWLNREY